MLNEINSGNLHPKNAKEALRANASHVNPIVRRVNEIDAAVINDNTILYATKTLTATEIVGTSAGDLGHADGTPLVDAPGTGYTLEFVSAVAIFDGMGVAYTGGGDDTFIQLGQVAMSGVVTKANLLGATGDKLVMFKPLSTAALPLTVNTTLNIKSTTAWTQPGTAAGTLKVITAYRKVPTGL